MHVWLYAAEGRSGQDVGHTGFALIVFLALRCDRKLGAGGRTCQYQFLSPAKQEDIGVSNAPTLGAFDGGGVGSTQTCYQCSSI